MFANKTGTLMHEIEVLRDFGRKKILVAKPDWDTRSGHGDIKDFHGKTMTAVEVSTTSPWEIFHLISREEECCGKLDVIAFDEIQFFSRDFYLVVNRLLERGYDVIASGLALDFRNEPFGSTLELIGLCPDLRTVRWLASRCAQCGEVAYLTQRLIDGKPAPYDSPQVLVGGKESYEPRCYSCFELPEKPSGAYSLKSP
ncbi:thymidine kinase [Candidatus Jorgensenbacteria bacterium]|nr:thymidine kinase [Candidatus Jorgensenbacteria bacterium]